MAFTVADSVTADQDPLARTSVTLDDYKAALEAMLVRPEREGSSRRDPAAQRPS